MWRFQAWGLGRPWANVGENARRSSVGRIRSGKLADATGRRKLPVTGRAGAYVYSTTKHVGSDALVRWAGRPGFIVVPAEHRRALPGWRAPGTKGSCVGRLWPLQRAGGASTDRS